MVEITLLLMCMSENWKRIRQLARYGPCYSLLILLKDFFANLIDIIKNLY